MYSSKYLELLIEYTEVVKWLHAPGPVLLAWLTGGLIALFGALTYAELAAAPPVPDAAVGAA